MKQDTCQTDVAATSFTLVAMDEHTQEPLADDRPDPKLSPLHEGQLSLISEGELPARAYEPDSADDSWSPVLGGTETNGAVLGDDALGSEDATVDTDDTLMEEDAIETPSADEEVDAEPATTEDQVDAEQTERDEQAIDDAAVVEEDSGAETAPDAAVDDAPADEQAADESLWPTLVMPSSAASVYDLPPLDRPRPERDRLIPKWVYIALAAALAVIALAAGGVWWYLASSQIAVPDVTGLQLTDATARLEKVGLTAQVSDRRFSAAPRDEVLMQTPGAGGEARRGDVVRLVVSAGTEEIAMPDVVGQGLPTARAQLEERGLVVIVDAVPSDAPSDTVLGTTPAAGAIVRTGDSVRVTVAAPAGGSGGLNPYDLQGLGVVIDPAPTATTSDTTMEVARRLRSLLEASGASVTVLRSATETAVPDAVRAQAAASATGTIGIGLSVTAASAAGRHVSTPVTGTPDALQRATLLASSITSQLAAVAPPVSSSKSSTETVLQASRLPWARVVLGSTSARADVNRFADPVWADQMARAIYNALGRLYGVREQ